MLFSSISFLYMFLPLVLLIYFAAPAKFKNYVLLAASLIFYFCGEPVYTWLLIFYAVSNYLYSLYIARHRGSRRAKGALIIAVLVNFGILSFFKYADFFMEDISLPIGISFFTFQTMSYTIDVYRQRVEAERNVVNLSAYVCLFPQLIAGPIVRYSDVAEKLRRRMPCLADISYGIRRFVFGLGKKVLIANVMGEVCAAYAAADTKTVLFAWLYAAAFTIQIYFDFSGYSDMAIGLGKIFGFDFPENFNYPYISKSITEFWRRWHITLSGWFRDYVYIPLGGNRVKTGRWLLNMGIVWLLTGLWHGANWNFAIWGIMYGLLIAMEKLWLGKLLDRAPGIVGHVYVLFFVMMGFVLFNGSSMEAIGEDFLHLFGAAGTPLTDGLSEYYLRSYIGVFFVAIIGATPLVRNMASKIAHSSAAVILEPMLVAAVLLSVTAYLVDGSFNPFLYFRF